MRPTPVILLAALALSSCRAPPSEPPPLSHEEVGDKAFREGLSAFKQDRYEAAATFFDIARRNLHEWDAAEAALKTTRQEIADRDALVDASFAFEKGELRAALDFVAKVDEGSRSFDGVAELRKKILAEEKRRTADAEALRSEGNLREAQAIVLDLQDDYPGDDAIRRLSAALADEIAEKERHKGGVPVPAPE